MHLEAHTPRKLSYEKFEAKASPFRVRGMSIVECHSVAPLFQMILNLVKMIETGHYECFP